MARRRIASPKITSARPTPRCVTTTRPLVRARGVGEDRLAQGGPRVRIAVELARVAVGQELVALVDEEEGGVARDLGGHDGGVVDRDDEGVGRQPVAGHRLTIRRCRERGRGHDHIGLRRRRARGWRHVDGRDADRVSGDLRQRLRPVGIAVVDGQLEARQEGTEDGQVAVALDPGTDQGHPRRPAVHPGRESANGDPGDGRGPHGRDRPAVEDGRRHARGGIAEDHQGADGRQAQRTVGTEPGDPLDPEQVLRSTRVGSAQVGGHRVCERAFRAWVDPDLGRQFGTRDEGGHRPFRECQALVERRHRRKHIAGREVAQRRHVGRGHGRASLRAADGRRGRPGPRTMRGATIAPWRRSMSRPASRT